MRGPPPKPQTRKVGTIQRARDEASIALTAMAAAPKSPGDEGPSAATAFVKKEELDDPPTAKPSPSLLGRLAPVLLFAAGAVLGAYLSSRVIEMEYSEPCAFIICRFIFTAFEC